MPVGVPFIEYEESDSEEESENGNGESESVVEPEWINLYHALYRERMLFLCQELEDTIANELIGLMLYLNEDDPSRALFLYINSPGGSVTCGIGIYDIMRCLNSGITTICMGTAASMASFILTGGTYGRRLALPHSRIMIHQPEGGSDGQATEIVSEAEEVSRIRQQVGLIYANRTSQSIERIAEDLDRDQFMSALQAQFYGLIDNVAYPSQKSYEPDFALTLNWNLFPRPYIQNFPTFIQTWAAALSPEFAVNPAGEPKTRIPLGVPVVFPDRTAEETGLPFINYGKSLVPEGTCISERVLKSYPTFVEESVENSGDSIPVVSLEGYKGVDTYGFVRAPMVIDSDQEVFVRTAISSLDQNKADLEKLLQVQIPKPEPERAEDFEQFLQKQQAQRMQQEQQRQLARRQRLQRKEFNTKLTEEFPFLPTQVQPIKIRPLPIPTIALAGKIGRLRPSTTESTNLTETNLTETNLTETNLTEQDREQDRLPVAK